MIVTIFDYYTDIRSVDSKYRVAFNIIEPTLRFIHFKKFNSKEEAVSLQNRIEAWLDKQEDDSEVLEHFENSSYWRDYCPWKNLK